MLMEVRSFKGLVATWTVLLGFVDVGVTVITGQPVHVTHLFFAGPIIGIWSWVVRVLNPDRLD